ncbi:hypothetical protein [Sphingomonas sediminicola]|uniref:hypothetical protein n=1 Tax=Sphingomonas sediminicola TaxID=386874 RepID=UPI001FEBD1F8|nr:hypothetical protein [Sphingomonas sediminicola]
MKDQPLTTGTLVAHFPELDRCAVMPHLKVLEEADLVIPSASVVSVGTISTWRRSRKFTSSGLGRTPRPPRCGSRSSSVTWNEDPRG